MDYSDVIIVGAGPYGLSVAAHVRALGLGFRIFGRPLQTWREHMPAGMLLKSDGFASNLSDPAGAFTLEHYCAQSGIPYDHTRRPVSLETFTAYGLAFQQRMVPELDEQEVTAIDPVQEGYRVTVADGSTCLSRNIVVAAGISHFAHMPPALRPLPRERLFHTSDVREPREWHGRKVTVIGGGASAIDTAVLLHEAGATVTLVARQRALKFAGPPPANGRSLWDSVRHPSSPIGPGWRSRLYCDFPGWFHRLPQGMRLRIVRGHLGPAAGYPMRDRFVGKVTTLLGHDIQRAKIERGQVRLVLRSEQGVTVQASDAVVAGTGYKVDVRRLEFLSPQIRDAIRCVEHTPILSSDFQSSVPGVYFVGAASVNSFGPMMRFACGSDWTARQLTRSLVARSARGGAPAAREALTR
jgi:thioredoxin reductase